MNQTNIIYNEECLEGMNRLEDQSIDFICTDLPYGTTACKWDIIIPFEPLWKQYKHVIKKNGAIVLTAKQPFTSLVVASNLLDFRYELIWEKDKGTDFGNANKKPLNAHENILVFYQKQPTYNKQMLKGKPYVKRNNRNNGADDLNYKSDNSGTWVNDGVRTPTSVRKIARDNIHKGLSIHETQKPVALMEYLIKSYSNENDLILDNCIGSGTTAIAALNTNRRYIGFELDEGYYKIAQQRIQEHGT